MEPVTELLGLQVLLGQVLEVALAVSMARGSNNNLVASRVTSDGDGSAELAGLSVDLEAVVEEVLEGGDVEDGVGGGDGAVDGELGVLSDGAGLLLLTSKTWLEPNSLDGLVVYLSEDGH